MRGRNMDCAFRPMIISRMLGVGKWDDRLALVLVGVI